MGKLITLVFSATSPQQQYSEFVYSDPDFGCCLDQLAGLVRSGWRLTSIKCVYQQGDFFPLPVKAFDGQPIGQGLRQLQQEWEVLLKVG